MEANDIERIIDEEYYGNALDWLRDNGYHWVYMYSEDGYDLYRLTSASNVIPSGAIHHFENKGFLFVRVELSGGDVWVIFKKKQAETTEGNKRGDENKMEDNADMPNDNKSVDGLMRSIFDNGFEFVKIEMKREEDGMDIIFTIAGIPTEKFDKLRSILEGAGLKLLLIDGWDDYAKITFRWSIK